MKKSILSILFVIATSILFTSCEKDPMPETEYTGDNTYIAGIEKVDAYAPVSLTAVDDTYWKHFKQIPGFNKIGACEFVLNGSPENCNKKVLDACKKAEEELSKQEIGNWGYGVYAINGISSSQKLYYHEF